MKSPHLLRIDDSPERFAPLVEAARALGLRVGWLELGALPAPVPDSLETAARLGVLRAVSVGEGRTVAVKPLRGAPVLKDLLREHFQGCALVLVKGEVDAPSLQTEDGTSWRLALTGSASRLFSTAQLVTTLRKPHPWDASA
jgi:hypothetical protein